ncbi:unnamed protein product [Peronospora belbahrii]|uniref:GATA-type domain-containing protein n=1 Tax=Peronospora belbahrii TaxID=622444 RepID=A0AAU9LKF1_9STRA|nr:unnamed protein product [Peronospora belbahrii]CAH0522665.1 unnamed protein product [Peronospora belbahrii]
MPKRKANWWPPGILSDPDVLSVDDEGRFVLCKICHVHYAVHGGKKPKPVIMNSNFRTRAWDVHKERTNSHRLQKQQERLQQTKLSSQQGQTPQGQQQVTLQHVQQQTQHRQQQAHGHIQSITQSQTQVQTKSVGRITSQTPSTLSQASPAPTLSTKEKVRQPSAQHSGIQVLQQRRQQQDQQQQQQQQQVVEEAKEAGHERLQKSARDSAVEKSANATPQAVTGTATSGAASIHDGTRMENSSKRPASTMPMGAPTSRRRVLRAGGPGSSRQLAADSSNHPYEKHLFTVPGVAHNAQRTLAFNKHAMAMERQADSSARWRHMHDDVSRALSPVPRRRLQGPASYTSGEIRAAKTLAQTETGDLGGNNSERVAKKLRSLNAEYHASNMRYADAYNMRHTDVLDRRSASYKEYWGTLRDVYTSSNTTGGGTRAAPYRKSHGSNPPAKSIHESKETEADFTTPDESGSSEDAFKPAVVVHDASLISAIEKLADVTSKQIANLYEKKSTGIRVSSREALAGLTSVMTDLRVLHGHAFERMIELQEKHLKVMENILDIKLRKEAARNASISSDNDGTTTTSGSSFGKSSGRTGAVAPEVNSILRQTNEQATKRIPYYCEPNSASRASG